MIETFGVPDYDPAEYYSTDEIRTGAGKALAELVGAPFDGAWLMWDFGSDEWVDDGPVIVCLGRHQLELCFGEAEHVFVTVDEIDRAKPLAWFDDGNRPYQWVNNPEREFQSLSFRRLERFGIGERGWSSGGIASYQPASFELDFGDAHFAIELGEESNSLRFRAPQTDSGIRVVWF